MLRWIIGPDGVIRGPAGSGRVAAVARDDLADVAAAVLAAPREHEGRAYDVTGPRALSLTEVAAEFSRATGRPISYVHQSEDEAWESRRGQAPDWQVDAWITTYLQLARGELDIVSETVSRIAGHPPRSLSDHLAGDPGLVAELRAALPA